MPDWYAVLAVDRNASKDEIRQAFRTAALKHHPDKNNADGSADDFSLVHQAFSVLSDPHLRAEYDSTLNITSPALVEQQIIRQNRQNDERQFFATKLAESERQQPRSHREHRKEHRKEPLLTAERLSQMKLATQRIRDELIAHKRAQNVDVRTLVGSTEPFETVTAARDYVDSHPGTALKSSDSELNYSEVYEQETLERIRRREKCDL